MKKACDISQTAHNYLIENIQQFISKKEKVIANKFIQLTENEDNVDGQAYASICACGSNGAILHYTDNYTELKKGELFLIDAGCEYLNYASDITRTYGIGEINIQKKKLIELVSNINTKCKLIVKQNTDFKDIHNLCMDLVYEAIIELDILNDEGKKKDKDLISKIFMPHGLGHFIGLDVHDVGGRLYNKLTGDSIILKENMVITIEPGIYFNKFLLNKYKDLWNENINTYINIGGVRIEDVVVVKKYNYEQLN
jgi:Xaa-Pro dipeptidase